MSLSKPLQLLSKTDNGYEVNTSDISIILDNIGDKNVAIVSINGNKRTGKSFLLNYFLRYLNYHSKYGNEWVNGVNETTLKGFDWRGGAQRHTVGIWMWSEPFMVKDRYGNDISLLLVDTQGNFDEETTVQECGVIFSLSLLLSSTMIFNIKSDLSEDKLQFVEFFTTFAESFCGESQSNAALFQKLVLLVRDWESEESYPYGYHDHINPSENNYTKEIFFPNSHQCLEAQNTRKEILKYFNQVSSYLMPNPGKKVSKSDFNGQTNLMDENFIEYITKFVSLMLSSDNIEPKQIGGHLMTGKSLNQYLNKWSEVIRTHKIPEAKSLTAATVEVIYRLALKHSLNLYNNNINEIIESKPTDELLYSYHETIKTQIFDYFLNEPEVRISEDMKTKLFEELSDGINKMFVTFRSNNNLRINKEDMKEKLNEVYVTEIQMKSQLEEDKIENAQKIADLQNKIENIQQQSMSKHLERENRFKDETDKIKLKMNEQNTEHSQSLADFDHKHVERKEELTDQTVNEFEQQMRMIEENANQMLYNMQKKMEELRIETEKERQNAQRLLDEEREKNERIQREIDEIKRANELNESEDDDVIRKVEKIGKEIGKEVENVFKGKFKW